MSKHFDYWRKRNKAGYQRLIATQPFLHENSEELIKFLDENNIFFDGISVFEIGCGCGRNLKYMADAQPTARLAGNDLSKALCFKHMAKNLKKVIDFREIDTKSLFSGKPYQCDLLISSDHMMHLDPDTAQFVLRAICDSWKPKYFVTRESKRDRIVKGKAIKYAHDYSVLNTTYDLVAEKVSAQDDSYNIRIYQKR